MSLLTTIEKIAPKAWKPFNFVFLGNNPSKRVERASISIAVIAVAIVAKIRCYSKKRSVGVKLLFLHQFITKGIKFALIGAIGTALNIGLLYVFTNYGHVFYLYSEFFAILLVFVSNYLGNIAIGNIKPLKIL